MKVYKEIYNIFTVQNNTKVTPTANFLHVYFIQISNFIINLNSKKGIVNPQSDQFLGTVKR